MKSTRCVEMDVRIVLVSTLLAICAFDLGKTGVVFNFHEKLRLATSTTQKNVHTSQIIRVPELECQDGYRKDRTGACRERLF